MRQCVPSSQWRWNRVQGSKGGHAYSNIKSGSSNGETKEEAMEPLVLWKGQWRKWSHWYCERGWPWWQVIFHWNFQIRRGRLTPMASCSSTPAPTWCFSTMIRSLSSKVQEGLRLALCWHWSLWAQSKSNQVNMDLGHLLELNAWDLHIEFKTIKCPAWWSPKRKNDTPSIPNCNSFDFFNPKFDHSSCSKNCVKYHFFCCAMLY